MKEGIKVVDSERCDLETLPLMVSKLFDQASYFAWSSVPMETVNGIISFLTLKRIRIGI